MNILILRGEHGLLHHAHEDDASYPELEPQYLPPVEGADREPGQPQHHVHTAHHGVEGQQGEVRDGEIPVRRAGLELHVNTDERDHTEGHHDS